jgi:hypothetical protein
VLTFKRMQNGPQNISSVSGRLLGFVRVVVGGHVCDLAVQAVTFDTDGERSAGGFFINDDQLGILVDDGAPAAQVQAQIEKGTAEAVRHLSRKYLN